MLPVDKIKSKLKIRTNTKLAMLLHIDQSTPSRWHGRGGNIPYKYHARIKELATEYGVILTSDDFMLSDDE